MVCNNLKTLILFWDKNNCQWEDNFNEIKLFKIFPNRQNVHLTIVALQPLFNTVPSKKIV